MRTRTLGALLVLGTMAVATGAAAEQRIRSFVGHAFDLDSNLKVYTEIHREVLRGDQGVELFTRYETPEGSAIAERSVDFSRDRLAPGFEFEDVRIGYTEGMRPGDEQITVFRRRPSRTELERRDMARPASLVADAGFDRLVTSSWDRLLAGDRLEADFLVASRFKSIRVRLEKGEEWTLDGEPVVTFEMLARNPIYRFLMGPVRVTYHREHRFLMRYEGISNLRDAAGDAYSVRIDFPLGERSDWSALAGG